MKRVFGILMISLVALGSQAKNKVNDPTSKASVVIATDVENNYLNIEVEDELTGAKITVSVFSSMGEIVLETTLGPGLNKVNVQDLKKGEYTAVVRKNGEYTSKRSFVVN